ncbi:MAG TPA: sugar ABC transporter substrate-binding protein [Firmicutes bacterium]|jgi:ribose transport system substrate-binding protein|nr:sugar ABC transporter substrate-binding protein [Bacillota bacterium]
MKRVVATLVAVLLMVSCLSGLAMAKGSEKTVGITYWCSSEFFMTLADGITQAAAAEGYKTVIVDAEQNAAKQIQIIEDFIAQDVSAVFLNPVDKDAIEPALRELDKAGIPVINFDAGVTNTDLIIAFVATNNYQAGVLCAESMLKDFPKGADIAILNYPSNGACNDREKGFLDTVKRKGINVLVTMDANANVEGGQAVVTDLLQSYDLDAIFCINDQCGLGAYAAVAVAGKDVKIYGVDGTQEAMDLIPGGIYRMTAAQSPKKIGAACYEAWKQYDKTGTVEPFTIEVDAYTIDETNVAQYSGKGYQ